MEAGYESLTVILTRELTALKDEIIKRSREQGAWASGRTASGYEVVVESGSHGWLGGFAYVGTLQSGRKPGKVPVYFSEIIKRWIIAKGLSFTDEKDLDRWARAIAWKIKREGSWLYRNHKTRDIFDTAVANFENRLAPQISYAFEQQVINSIFD